MATSPNLPAAPVLSPTLAAVLAAVAAIVSTLAVTWGLAPEPVDYSVQIASLTLRVDALEAEAIDGDAPAP